MVSTSRPRIVNLPLENFSKGVASVASGNERQYSRNSSIFMFNCFDSLFLLDEPAASAGFLGCYIDGHPFGNAHLSV